MSIIKMFNTMCITKPDDRLGKLCYSSSNSTDLCQVANFSTQIPDFGSHSPTLLDLLLFFQYIFFFSILTCI